METTILRCLAVCWLCAPLPVRTQSTFVNLDFELARVPSGTAGWLAASDALPGWTCYLGANQQSEVSYNGISIGIALIALQGPESSWFSPIQGNYSPLLIAGVDPETGLGLVPAAIGQTGFI